MHPLHDDVARILAEKVRVRGVVVWYDPRLEFPAFVRELRNGIEDQSAHMLLAGGPAVLHEYRGSMFELRALIEPELSRENPQRLVVYLPGCRQDDETSVLMEAQKAGDVWEPRLKAIARNVLRRKLTDGDIDQLLAPESVTYEFLAKAAADPDASPSALKAIFSEASGGDAILATWLVDVSRDAEITGKGAAGELTRLVESRLGLSLPDGVGTAKARAAVLRYVLGGEFRSDLGAPAPASLDAVPAPKTKDAETSVREMAGRLRASYPSLYPAIANQVELELGLADAQIPGPALGSIDTFRFEERVVFEYTADLISTGAYDEALRHVAERAGSFWLAQDLVRTAQWEASKRMAELGRVATAILAEIGSVGGSSADWVRRYTEADGWLELDRVQRRMETWIGKLDDEPPERSVGVVRRAYETACQAMAKGFTKVLESGGWTVPGVLQQTQVFGQVVAQQPKPVAYFLVDAMRYEMGAELVGRLPAGAEVRIRPAIAALPSITPVGMAALQPDAEGSFAVVAENGKFGSRIEDAFLPDLPARRKFAASRIPALADMTLGDVLTWSKTKLASAVAGAEVVVVRSQEIDNAGEGGFAYQARQVMDSVLDDLARAVRRLTEAGIEHYVLSADHGYLFAHGDRDESMKVDDPGGARIDFHRRCWIGRGGATPAGCIRVTATELGYASDLEFVFPRGVGVFRTGGDLGYHHGGSSLQEVVIPVVTVRTQQAAATIEPVDKLAVTNLPYEINNRVFSITVVSGKPNLGLFSGGRAIQPVVLSDGTQVGKAGIVDGADLDAGSGIVTLQPGKPATIGFLLMGEGLDAVRIVIRDPETDLPLYTSPSDIKVRLGVG
jgi:hypothetical protein